MQNVVIFSDSGISSNWWHACHRSSLEKNEAPLSSRETDSRVGMGCLVRLMAVLATRISTHSLMLLFRLGTIGTLRFTTRQLDDAAS